MKLGFLGTGHVGLVNLCGFAELGFTVIGYDKPEVIENLKNGLIHFYEPKLNDLLIKNRGKITFVSDPAPFFSMIDVLFVCVATPTVNGITDLSQIESAANLTSMYIKNRLLVIGKSTVPTGTYDYFKQLVLEQCPFADIDIACVPEFLAEGSAVDDFFSGDRIIIGSDNPKTKNILEKIYEQFPAKKIYCSLRSAEIIKQASNTFLAMKISYINLVSDFCEKSSVNIHEVAQGIGADKRIGTAHLHAGIGYGGNCLPKDILSFKSIMAKDNIDSTLLNAVIEINEKRASRVITRLKKENLLNKNITFWGLAFKKNCDDMTNSQAIKIIDAIPKAKKGEIKYYDAYIQQERLYRPNLKRCRNISESLKDSDVLIIFTDCPEFIDFGLSNIISSMNPNPVIFDCKNIIPYAEALNAVDYYSFGNYNNGKVI